MENDKKSKKSSIDKLRKVLDNDSNKDLHPEDEKYLRDLSNRLKEKSKKQEIYKKSSFEKKEIDKKDSMEPKVAIHPRKVKKIEKLPELKEEEIKPKADEIKGDSFKDEDIFEIEKIEHKEPEFIQVKPKEFEKQPGILPVSVEKEEAKEEEELSEWETVEYVDKKIESEEEKSDDEIPSWEKHDEDEYVIKEDEEDLIDVQKIQTDISKKPEKVEEKPEIKKEAKIGKYCSKCGSNLIEGAKFCIECGEKTDKSEERKTKEGTLTFIPVKEIKKESEEPHWESIDEEKIEDKKIKPEEELQTWETIDLEEEAEPEVDKEIKLEAFEDVKSIDDGTAILLYDNGYKTVKMVEEADLKDLTRVKGLKKKIAKNIKKELEEKNNKGNVEPIVVEDTAKVEVLKEEIESKDQDEIIEREMKIDAFKDIKSIDEETAVLLYDSGYNSVDTLNVATVKDLSKIKGIKRKTAKNIKKELDEKLEESIDVKPIDIDDSAKGNVTEDQIKKDDTFEDVETPNPMELHTKTDEWEPVDEEEIEDKEVKPEEEMQTWEAIEVEEETEPKVDNEVKLEAFKEIDIIDNDTAILLYDNGYKDVEAIKDASVKELGKIKGIKKKTVKSIKKKLEEEVKEKKSIEDKEIKPEEKEPQTMEAIEIEEETEPKVDNEVKLEAFKEIDIIDNDTAILLYDNGYKDVEAIKDASVKELGKIKGIKKKTVKSIKKKLEENQNDDTLTEDDDTLTEEEEVKDEEYFLDEEEIDKKDSDKLEEKIINKESDETSEINFFEEKEDIEEIKEKKIKSEEKIYKEDSTKLEEKIINKESDETSEINFFEEKEDIEEIKEKEDIEDVKPVQEEKNEVFKDIKSIDDKTAKLLKNNGISSIETLNKKTIKDLIKIRGIRKKLAKEIKNELKDFVKKLDEKNKNGFDRGNNPFIDEDEDDGWESIDKKKTPESTIKKPKEFRHGNYTLYEKEVNTKSGKKQKIRFFSKVKPDDAKPINLPKGYEVKENKKTGVPYIKKKK